MLVVALLSLAARAGSPALLSAGEAEDRPSPGAGLGRPSAVTGGQDVPDDLTWPDTAGVYLKGQGVGCTGVLIAPDVVLTAGHCATDPNAPITAVILGVNNYNHDGEYIRAEEVIEYPDSWGDGYDIAVVVLEEESQYEPRVIATDCMRDEIVDGAPVTIVGYGATDAYGNVYTPRLQEGFTEMVDADCSHTNWGCSPSLQPNGELGAGGDGVDACYGDSGGPLYRETSRGTFLVGIVSRGWYYADCGDGGIWVRPDKPELFDWIEEVTDRTLPRPVCSEPPDPVAAPIYVPEDEPGQTVIDARDPDGDDVVYEITASPGNGEAVVLPDGVVRFTPDPGFIGSDAVVVRVTDVAGLSAVVEVPIKVLTKREYRQLTGEGGGCGCAASVAPSGLLAGLAGLVGLIARRRR